MKYLLTILGLSFSFKSVGQDKHPELIYSCKKTINGKSAYQIFNSKGQKIISNDVDWAYTNAWTWLFIQDEKTKLKTLYTYKGESIGIDSIEESQSAYLNLSLLGLKRNNKWGFYDKNGKLKLAHLYSEVSHFHNNMAAVKVDNEIFMIDTNGIKLSIKYNPNDQYYSFQDEDIALGQDGDFENDEYIKITKNNKVGLLRKKDNKLIIQAIYDNLSILNVDFKRITARKNNKYGVLSLEGKVIIPIVYDNVYLLTDYL